MHIITDWHELKANNDKPPYHSLSNCIFQGVEAHTKENYINHWIDSALIILDSQADNALLSITDKESFIQHFPIHYQAHITYLLNYPEFTERFNEQYFIALAIWEDGGSGIFLVFDNKLKTQCSILNNLTKESFYDGISIND